MEKKPMRKLRLPSLRALPLLLCLGMIPPTSFAQEIPPGRKGTDSGAIEQRFDELLTEFRQAQTEYFRPFMEAKTEADREKVMLDPAQDPVSLFAPRFVAFAEKNEGSAPALKAWLWVLESSARTPRTIERGRHAVKVLAERYKDHPDLAEPLRFAFYAGPTKRMKSRALLS